MRGGPIPLHVGCRASVRNDGDAGPLYLTFDDGPDPAWTALLLDRLAEEHATATFFVMAQEAVDAPYVVERMLADGHDVELHCLFHVRHTELSEASIHEDATRALRMLGDIGVLPRRWRTPWGVVTSATRRVAAELGLELVGWSADSQDWRGDAAVVLHDRVADRVEGGTIVLLHDGIGPGARRADCRETIGLIGALVSTARRRGLRVVALSRGMP
jgi:peptidoglycan/xylan/chitin deacetylase (PgdA/CDA1 family)